MPMVRGRHTTKRKTKLLKYLPRGAFQNPMFSPGRDKQQRLYPSSGFSGPIVSIIPDEARRRPRRGSRADADDDDDVSRLGPTQEPSSPKVSCIGQIKLRSKEKKNKMKAKKAHEKHNQQQQQQQQQPSHHNHDDHKAKEEAKAKKQDSKIRKMFGFAARASKTAYARDGGGGSTKSEAAAPALGQMRRFSSGRQSLANFDWTAQIAPVNDLEDRNCHSDEEFGGYSDGEEEFEEEVIIPFSAPILMGTKEPRREVNLWQRRNTASPPPLQLKPIKIRGA